MGPLLIHHPSIHPQMKTILKDLFQADWGPTMRGIAWALGHAVMVPVAIAVVFAQWLAFAWRRPLAGVLALVPVRPNSGDAASSSNLATANPLAHAAECYARTSTHVRAKAFADLYLMVPVPEPIAPAPAPRTRRRRATR